jgi:cadmium resistance protein CadD (predicted permease)
MLAKFVYWTGALDLLIGIVVWAQHLSNPQVDQFVPGITLGTFLVMSAACLMWASKDLVPRSPIVFWQGLVRLSAAAAVLYAVPAGLAESQQYGIVVMDGVIGTTYVIGMAKLTGCSIFELLRCETTPRARAA